MLTKFTLKASLAGSHRLAVSGALIEPTWIGRAHAAHVYGPSDLQDSRCNCGAVAGFRPKAHARRLDVLEHDERPYESV